MDSEELKRRTKDFTYRCIKLSTALPKTILASHVKRQLIRCSTSVSANYRAVCIAQSKASFTAKMSIVIEEADESAFWLELIIDEKILKADLVTPLLTEANELTSIFISSRKTAQKRD